MDRMTESAATAATIACEISRLPGDLISASIIARTGPRDACCIAVVSPAFRIAADSDIVRNSFLPSNLPLLAIEELSPPPPSMKALFMRLCDGPVLLADGLMSMWLVKETRAMCYMLSARKLSIDCNDVPADYRWIPIIGSWIFSDAAKLWRGRRLEIHGKIDSSILSKHTTYTAYIVLGVDDISCCCFGSSQKTQVTISLGGSTSTRDVLLDTHDHVHLHSWQMRRGGISRACGALLGDPRFSSQRSDGWMELELGEFYNGSEKVRMATYPSALWIPHSGEMVSLSWALRSLLRGKRLENFIMPANNR